MYKITVQTLAGAEHTLYYPATMEYIVTSAVLSLKIGDAGEFEFTVPQSNPVYDELVDHAIITVYEDSNEIWRGDIRDIKVNFDKSLSIYALEDLSWLGDDTVSMSKITAETYTQRLTNVLSTYNSTQPAKRKFTAGNITAVTPADACTWAPEWEQTLLDCIREFIAGENGYLKIRRETSGGSTTRYLDVVDIDDYGSQATQEIAFGSNLLEFVKDIDMTNFCNVLYPFGAETETELYDDQMARLQGTTLSKDASVTAFGRHARTVIFETDDLTTLNRLALAYINRYSEPSMTLEVTAVDLGNIEAVNRLHVGDSVRIVANTFGIDQWIYITEQELDLLDIANNKLELSDSVRHSSLTSQIASQADAIKNIRSPLSVLDEAKKEAFDILTGENGGIITFVKNANDQIIEQQIANNLDIDQATKCWRWNLNGLAYLSRTYPTDPWEVVIAATMDGGIVADFITSGTMLADRIRGGTLELGGYNNQNGVMLAYANTSGGSGSYTTPGTDVDTYISYQTTGLTGTYKGYLSIENISDEDDFKAEAIIYKYDGGYITLETLDLQPGYNAITDDMVLQDDGNTTWYTVRINEPSTHHATFDFDCVLNNINTRVDEDGVTTSYLHATGGLIDGTLKLGSKGVLGSYSASDMNGLKLSNGSLGVSISLSSSSWAGISYGKEANERIPGWGNASKASLILWNGAESGAGVHVVNGSPNAGDTGKFTALKDNVMQVWVNSNLRAYFNESGSHTSSDKRLKKDIKPFDLSKVREFFRRINPVTFAFKHNDTKHFGVVAQELEQVLKETELENDAIIEEDAEKYKSVCYAEFHGIEMAAIKDLYTIINKQRDEIDGLKLLVKELINREEK